MAFKRIPMAALLFYAGGSCYFILGILGSYLQYLPGDAGDSRFIHYLLEHGYRFLKGLDPSFWDARFMYPYKNTIALSDNMLGTMPLYSLFRLLGLAPQSAYQVWWIGIVSLNFWVCYAVLNKWFGHRTVAALIAFVFAFGSGHFSQIGYTQIMIRFCIPPAVYYACLLVSRPQLRYAYLYCAVMVLQFYCVIYFGFLLFYFTLLFMLLYSLVKKDRSWLRFYFAAPQRNQTLALMGASILVLLWLFIPYFRSVSEVGLKLYKNSVPFLPTLQSYFFAHEAMLPYGFLSQHGKAIYPEWWLQNIFPGLFVYAGFIGFGIYLLICRLRKKPIPLLQLSVFLSALIVFVLFTRSSNGLSLYFLIFKLPGLNSLKVLTRFMELQSFFLLLLSAWLVLKLVQRFGTGALVLAILLCVADQLFDPSQVLRISKWEVTSRVVWQLNKMQAYDPQRHSCVAYLGSSDEPAAYRHLDMMLAAQRLGINCVNGYSSNCKDEFGDFFIRCDSAGLYKWLDYNRMSRDSVLVIP